MILFCLCTDDVNININRITRRVKEGGHSIPPEIVIHRYKLVLTYLKTKLWLFKEIYFIDNSADEAIECGFIKDKRLTELIAAKPKWFDDVLSVEKRLRKRK